VSPAIIGDWRPAWRPGWIRGFKPALISYLYLSPSGLDLQEGYVQTYVDIVPNAGGLAFPYLERDFQRPEEAFELLPGVTIPPGNLDAWRYGLFLQSDQSARLALNADLSNGGFFGGRKLGLSSGLRVAPVPRVALAVAYDLNRLTGVGIEQRNLTTHLVAPELRLGLNPQTQVTLFWQYNSTIRQGTWNARLSWEFAPLSYVYLVYNDQRAMGAADLASRFLPRQQLVMKVVYLRQL
jgi:hypothetical protein